jgi:hypothetical protein
MIPRCLRRHVAQVLPPCTHHILSRVALCAQREPRSIPNRSATFDNGDPGLVGHECGGLVGCLTLTYKPSDDRSAGARWHVGIARRVGARNEPSGQRCVPTPEPCQRGIHESIKIWTRYPSGAEEADPLATNLEAVTIDMISFPNLLRCVGHTGAAQRYRDTATELRIEDTEDSGEASPADVDEGLRGGAGTAPAFSLTRRPRAL